MRLLTSRFPAKKENFTVFSSDECLWHESHNEHPECASRLKVILNECKNLDQQLPLSFECAESAKVSDLTTVHENGYLQGLESSIHSGKPYFMSTENYVCEDSLFAILAAAGQSLALGDLLLDGGAGFALVRPPGHHASQAKAEGFCFVNNVALAEKRIRQQDPKAKVLIVDFDVHHGNGISFIYRRDDLVYYFSLHGAPEHIYPHTGYRDEYGLEEGKGFTRNIPLEVGCDGATWLNSLESNLDRILLDFEPDYLLVSAGFDAHQDDPFSIMKVRDEDYYKAVQYLYEIAKKYCSSRVGFFLEGGYSLEVLKRVVPKCIEELSQAHQSS